MREQPHEHCVDLVVVKMVAKHWPIDCWKWRDLQQWRVLPGMLEETVNLKE
jgi:hypothetical protein